MTTGVRPKTVRLLGRILKPWCDEGLVTVVEQNTILSNLKHLADKGELLPAIQPRLIDQDEAAAMLGISKANFKKMEKEGRLQIQRRMIGTSVRYRLTDVVIYINADGGACDDATPVE